MRFDKQRLMPGFLVGLGAMLVTACGGSAPAEQAPAALLVTPYPVSQSADYVSEQRFSGRVEAGRSSQLGFELGGELSEVAVDDGALVRAGDVLARLDAARLRAARDAAEAAMQQAEAQATLSASTYERVAEARTFDGVSQQELDEALELKRRTEAARLSAQAQLDRILVDLRKTELRAPYDALVVSRMADEGQVLGAGQAVLGIQELAALEVRLAVTTEALERIAIDDEVQLEIGSETTGARVTAVVPRRDARTRAVDVRLELPETAPARVGDVAELRFESRISVDGFWVPLDALTEGARGVWHVLAIGSGDGVLDREERLDTGATHVLQRRPVEIIHYDETRAYVRGALEDGDEIVAEGLQRVVAGQGVRVGKPLDFVPETVAAPAS
ncbi:MAG: efflux RND transporter periplasmic adaptor subunit [Pseudomonadota bacterium]